MRESVWLTNEDIPHDRDVIVTIEKVHERRNVVFQGGRKVPRCFSLKFVGKDRELKVNAGHRKILNELTGKGDAGAWKGLGVYLWVEQNVRRGDGTSGPAVRIRAKRPPVKDAPAEEPREREPGDDG